MTDREGTGIPSDYKLRWNACPAFLLIVELSRL